MKPNDKEEKDQIDTKHGAKYFLDIIRIPQKNPSNISQTEIEQDWSDPQGLHRSERCNLSTVTGVLG